MECGIQRRGHAAQNVQRSRFFFLHLLLLREESWGDRALADADAGRTDGAPVAAAGMFSFTTRQRRTSASALARSTIAHLGKRPNPSDSGVLRQPAGPYFQCTTWSVQLARRQRRRRRTRAERKSDWSLGPSPGLTKARKVFKMECQSLCDTSVAYRAYLSREGVETGEPTKSMIGKRSASGRW